MDDAVPAFNLPERRPSFEVASFTEFEAALIPGQPTRSRGRLRFFADKSAGEGWQGASGATVNP